MMPHPITRIGFVSFCMTLGDALELNDVLYFPILTRRLLLALAIIDLSV